MGTCSFRTTYIRKFPYIILPRSICGLTSLVPLADGCSKKKSMSDVVRKFCLLDVEFNKSSVTYNFAKKVPSCNTPSWKGAIDTLLVENVGWMLIPPHCRDQPPRPPSAIRARQSGEKAHMTFRLSVWKCFTLSTGPQSSNKGSGFMGPNWSKLSNGATKPSHDWFRLRVP